MSDSLQRSKQICQFVLILVPCVVLTAAAKDFWEAKAFTEWNEQEAMRMLSESPWARTLTVLGATLGSAQVANRVTDLPTLATANAGRSAGNVAGQLGSGTGTNDSVPLYVSWLSSVKIRQALGRLGELRNHAPESEVKKFVEQSIEDYQIAISGPILDSFNDLSFDDFKEKTYLASKKDKSKQIPLKSYAAPKNRNDGMVVFSFERQIDGKPAFGMDDQEVEFVAQGRKIRLKASFKLAKMMVDGNLDL